MVAFLALVMTNVAPPKGMLCPMLYMMGELAGVLVGLGVAVWVGVWVGVWVAVAVGVAPPGVGVVPVVPPPEQAAKAKTRMIMML